ncbi:radical SAM protein [Flavobacterium sp.]|uniref:radical SAM protein n=1 Tax=Flavobacterium sp. TaxID=239 RepID=UPI0039E2BF75
MTKPFRYVLLKIASRCNINCSYCYWFRDKEVYRKPKLMEPLVIEAFLKKLELHILKYNLKVFNIIFHGGEPLLFGKQRLFNLCNDLFALQHRCECEIRLSITTNGILIDEDYCTIIKHFDINVTISLDGDQKTNDENRIDFRGNGTYAKVIEKFPLLNKYEIPFNILSVCNPKVDPKRVVHHFTKDLKIENFDLLFPDITHEDVYVSIADYYIKLFDMWYADGKNKSFNIRIFHTIISGLLGFPSLTEGFGLDPITTISINTDGQMEQLDVMNIIPCKSRSKTSILNSELQDFVNDNAFQETYNNSTNLALECLKCEFINSCGGGYLPHRWSEKNSFNNVSVYCKDIKKIFSYIGERISPEIIIKTETGNLQLSSI